MKSCMKQPWTSSSRQPPALELPIEPEWKPAIKANLEVTLRLGKVVAELPAAGRGRAGTRVRGLIR